MAMLAYGRSTSVTAAGGLVWSDGSMVDATIAPAGHVVLNLLATRGASADSADGLGASPRGVAVPGAMQSLQIDGAGFGNPLEVPFYLVEEGGGPGAFDWDLCGLSELPTGGSVHIAGAGRIQAGRGSAQWAWSAGVIDASAGVAIAADGDYEFALTAGYPADACAIAGQSADAYAPGRLRGLAFDHPADPTRKRLTLLEEGVFGGPSVRAAYDVDVLVMALGRHAPANRLRSSAIVVFHDGASFQTLQNSGRFSNVETLGVGLARLNMLPDQGAAASRSAVFLIPVATLGPPAAYEGAGYSRPSATAIDLQMGIEAGGGSVLANGTYVVLLVELPAEGAP